MHSKKWITITDKIYCNKNYVTMALLSKVRYSWTQHRDTRIVDLTTEVATKWLAGGQHVQRGQVTGGTAQDFTPLRMVQSCKLQIISRIFHLIFSDYSWLQVTETMENKRQMGGLPYTHRERVCTFQSFHNPVSHCLTPSQALWINHQGLVQGFALSLFLSVLPE